MASTETKRKWYPEVVTNHSDRGEPGYEPKCDISQAVRIKFPKAGGSYWLLLVHPKTVEAWRAYTFLMGRYNLVVPPAGGTHNCRNIGDGDWPSLHAYCLACDLPPNSYKPAGFQAAVLAVKTNSGAGVFKNLASVNDRMHDEIDCSPAALESGIDWSTVEGYEMPLTDAEQKAIDWLVNALASRFGDDPPWADLAWEQFLTEWSGKPGPLNVVTHVQLAHIYYRLRGHLNLLDKKLLAAIDAIDGMSAEDVKALIAETSLQPPG